MSRLVDAVRLQRMPGTRLDGEALLIYLANLAQVMLAHTPAAEQQGLWDPVAWRKARPDLPTGVVELLTLYDAAARRDWANVDRAAERILGGTVDPSPAEIKEQVLVLSMLAGLAQRQPDAVLTREVRWGSQVRAGALADTRRFMKAWADGQEPVCAARPEGKLQP
ncbi:MAG: hypothetical protein EOP39_26825 [Rubrivivax sp.]|nr:MAG: hypothetical protein EOP39_26825 [Rubrivivax sp.]